MTSPTASCHHSATGCTSLAIATNLQEGFSRPRVEIVPLRTGLPTGLPRGSAVIIEAVPAPAPTGSRLARIRQSLTPREWVRVSGLFGFIALLHIVGWGVLVFVVVPAHYQIGTGLFGIGTGLTAYTLGLRHAFDADHIAAIDNTTRKLMGEGKRPLSVGFWFSLGHSSVVLVLTCCWSHRSQGGRRPAGKQQFQPAQHGRADRYRGLRRIPLPDRHHQPDHSGRHPEGVPEDAQRRVRRGDAGGPPEQPRPDEPVPRPDHASGDQAVADLPGRHAVRPRVRHGHRGRAAGTGRRQRGRRACPGTR